MSLDRITKDGFLVTSKRPSLSNVSFISLRNSLHAYVRTYSSVIRHLSSATQSGSESIEISDEEWDYKYPVRYIDYTCAAITNFQHFCELIIKDILAKINPLLAVDATNKHVLFHKLLEREEVALEDIDSLQQIEFSKAHQRLQDLIRAGRVPPQYNFFTEHKSFLDALNHLRNRILHRGVYVLNYKALDELFTRHALPFMFRVLALDNYSGNKLWKPKPIHLDFDPIIELSLSWPNGVSYPFEKIALLKELSKAAYELPDELKFNAHTRKYHSLKTRNEAERVEKVAELYAKETFGDYIIDCPVCSFKSLVAFEDTYETEHGETGAVLHVPFFYSIKCSYCNFELFPEVESFSDFGLPIPDYWNRDIYL